MTISDIITEFGAYYIKNADNMKRVYKLLNARSATLEVLTPMVTDDTKFRAAKVLMTRILQPFQKAYTPVNPATVKPVEIDLFQIKADLQETPHDFQASWLGFLTGDQIDVKQWPFVRWFIENYVLPKIKEDYELNEIFWGERAEPTPGVAGPVGTSMDGLNTHILNGIDGGTIIPITTGAPAADASDFCDQIEDFVDQINQRYWGLTMNLCMNESLVRRFLRGCREKYGKDTDYKGSNGKVEFTNINVIGLPSMIGSEGWFCTPQENAVHLIKKQTNMDVLQVENVDRTLKLYTDFWRGVGFLVHEAVFVNDQFQTAESES